MNIPFAVWVFIVVYPLAIVMVLVIKDLLPRLRRERRAGTLLAQYPDAEQTTVYLALHSILEPWRQREIDAKHSEMKANGWTFLRATSANPSGSTGMWERALNLHYIRLPDSAASIAA